MLPQSIGRSLSVHLPAEADVHLSTELDVHFSTEAHVPSKGLKSWPPHADNMWLTIACRDSTDAGLASHTQRTWTNGAMWRSKVANVDNTLRKEHGGEAVPGHRQPLGVRFLLGPAPPRCVSPHS
jgi:hypothetical protein